MNSASVVFVLFFPTGLGGKGAITVCYYHVDGVRVPHLVYGVWYYVFPIIVTGCTM